MVQPSPRATPTDYILTPRIFFFIPKEAERGVLHGLQRVEGFSRTTSFDALIINENLNCTYTPLCRKRKRPSSFIGYFIAKQRKENTFLCNVEIHKKDRMRHSNTMYNGFKITMSIK